MLQTEFSIRRGMRPAAELAKDRPHGDRLRYMGGCRCQACRAANAAYEAQRKEAREAGEGNGIVPARRAKKHIAWLSKNGIGRRSISAVSDVGETIICGIKRGTKKNIRAATERRILAVTVAAAADQAKIDAAATWKLLDDLLEAGFTKTRLAYELGNKTPALQLKRDRVTVRNAYKVERMHRRLMDSDETPVDASLASSCIKSLRAELISTQQIARELNLPESSIEDGEIKLPYKIPRGLEKQVVAMHKRYQE